ncbi:MAG: TRAP transporter fused permease subunit, partial [Mycobacteriaceae bacterium]|nr:TRAP transporter fused permease subunit [Mycobacteriaceae bacterium]
MDTAAVDEEQPARVLSGPVGRAAGAVAGGMSLFAVYQVFRPQSGGPQVYLMLFLGGTLPLVFLWYRSGWRSSPLHRPSALDWVLAALAAAAAVYPLLPWRIADGGGGFDAFLDRQGGLARVDVVAGALLTLLALEACRRTTGWALPAICVLFFAYAYYGSYLPPEWSIAHPGVDFEQIVNGLYSEQNGIWGTPLEVAGTYIVLFTIYGAALELSGAGGFFVELSRAAFRRSRTGPARTAVASGFLLGTVSGSGTATTATIGGVTWPILRRAGYPREQAGGMLAAAGIGATLSPPTLGAAAFIIAEQLQVSYLQVLIWATIPTLLYYLGILLAVEIDARRFGAQQVAVDSPPVWKLLLRFGYHFSSLIVIVALLALGVPPFDAVVDATAIALALTLADPRALRVMRTVAAAREPRAALRAAAVAPARVGAALIAGTRSVLGVTAVCAAAGIITTSMNKTGLGQQISSLMVNGATSVTHTPAAVLVLTAVAAAIAIAVLGLAVPVTASFIIAWVVMAPVFTDELGVAAPAVAMFVFYYTVLSEVSPPTSLASVAAAAITGGKLMPTMWQTARYTLPAFLVPLAFVATPTGAYLLVTGLPPGTYGQDAIITQPWTGILWAAAVSAVAVAALAGAAGGWLVHRAHWPERVLLAAAALMLLYLQPVSIAV